MKLTALFVFIACMQVSASTHAQTITLSAKNEPLVKVFEEIRRQAGYEFLCNVFDLRKASPVTADFQAASLEVVLEKIFRGQPLTYTIVNEKTIVVRERSPVEKQKTNDLSSDVAPPLIDIHGHVTDSTGAPLAGASVTVKGTKKGIQTDANGDFSLTGLAENATLKVSFAGFEAQEVKLNGRKEIRLVLVIAKSTLDETVVIPYGTTTRRLNTGDITTVTAKEIEQQPVSNPLAALIGRVPGLVITQVTGAPGGSFKVQIRGQNSLLSGNDPFYVIDGVPYISQMPETGLLNPNLYVGNPLNFINPYDIESIQVLKDADATSIYGSRAANGAILITTKKGKAGSMKIDANIQSGSSQATKQLDVLNLRQYLDMRHEAFANDGATPGPGDHDVNGDWDTTRYTDWQKELLANPAYYTNAQLSASGGSANTQYLIGVGYNKQTTGYPKIDPKDGADQRVSTHFNINSESANKKLRISLTGSYSWDKNTVLNYGFTGIAFTLAPDAPPIYNADGTLNWAPKNPGEAGTWSNPFANVYHGFKAITSDLVSDAVISYSILPGLDIKSSFGYNNLQSDVVSTAPTTVNDPARHVTTGSSQFNTQYSRAWVIEPQLNYKLDLGKGILTALVGSTFNDRNTSSQNLNADGFISDALLENIQAAGSITARTGTASQYNYEAIFGRINYNWEDKYIVNFNARRDGSSRFGPGKQFANFGSIGAAWIFTKENLFPKSLSFLSFGKLRGSYGTTGSDQIGDYQFLDLYSITEFPYQGLQGLYPATLYNPDLAWEINRKLEGAIELGFLHDRINITASFYQNRSSNQLVTTPISLVTGYSTIPSNLPATVQNTGQEFVLRTVNIRTNNFSWSTMINLTISRNKLLAYPNLATSPYQNQFIIGQPISVQRVYRFAGVNDTTGVFQFATAKGGNTYTPNILTDYTTVKTTPDYFGGFENSITYKGISLDFLFQFVKQLGENIYGSYTVMPGTAYNQSVSVLDHWQKPGDKKPFQKFSQNYASNTYSALNYAEQSDYIYSDASFIRLKNVSMSWQLPQSWQKKIGTDNFRIYMQGQNLLTITHYNGIDPESQGRGMPPLRTWTIGCQVTF